ncbi:MAG: hypothetical protein R2785_05260 [Flavobacteriaceae bacterium]
MKIIFKYVITCCLVLCFVSVKSQEQKVSSQNTFIEIQVSGNQIKESVSISGDLNNSKQNVTALIFPDGNSGQYKLTELTFLDASQEISVQIIVPAQKGLIELKEGNPKYKLNINVGDISLKAQSVSVTIEEVVIDKIMKMKASYIKGSFEGIAIHKFTENGKQITEPYMVSGNFQFTSPRYKPKNKK